MIIISASNQQLDGGKAWGESTSGSSIASFPRLGRNLGTRLKALFGSLFGQNYSKQTRLVRYWNIALLMRSCGQGGFMFSSTIFSQKGKLPAPMHWHAADY